MKKDCGIFDKPTALGTTTGSGTSCQPDNTALVKEVQKYLKEHGAPNLKIDGHWHGCTASAFKKIFGRIYVTSDDIHRMTGKTCKSIDTYFGGVLPLFTFASVNTCLDASDGVAAGTGPAGGAVPQECSAGSVWNDIIRSCVPDPLGVMGGSQQGQTTSQQTQCPQGTVWNDLFKTCGPDIFGAGTGITNPPTECPPGSMKILDKCVGQGGVTNPSECPSGQQKIGNQCVGGPSGVTDIVGGLLNTIGGVFGQGTGQQPGQPSQPGQPGSGTIPGLTDMLNNLLSGVTGMFGGGGAQGQCAPGMVFNPITGQCVGPGGTSVPPGWTNPELTKEKSVWGSMGPVIIGVLAVGAAVGAYAIYKSKEEPSYEPMDDEGYGDEQSWEQPEVQVVVVDETDPRLLEQQERFGYGRY